ESAALIGLIDAVDRFDPERGVPFEGYASLRIRGAVLDEVRRVDELGRADRRRQREAAAQGEAGTYHGTVSLDELIERGYHGGAEQDELAERYDAAQARSSRGRAPAAPTRTWSLVTPSGRRRRARPRARAAAGGVRSHRASRSGFRRGARDRRRAGG